MPRRRIYESNAERQAAYREREANVRTYRRTLGIIAAGRGEQLQELSALIREAKRKCDRLRPYADADNNVPLLSVADLVDDMEQLIREIVS